MNMDHENYFTTRTLDTVQSEAVTEFKKDVSEKRKALPKPRRNANRGFVVRSDSNPRSFQIGKKVSYKVFRLWPDDIQAIYLKDIVNRYPGITIRNIAVMLGCSAITIKGVNQKLGNIIPAFDRKNPKVSHDDIVNRFYTDFDCLKEAEESAKTNAEYRKKSEAKKSSSGIKIQNMSMTVSFNIDTDNIAKFLKEHGYSGQVTLTISKNINV